MKKVMLRSNAEYFLARRLSLTRGVGRSRVTVRIAVTATAVSMAVMIVALAVVFGFKREIAARLSGFDAHVQIVSRQSNNSLESPPITLDTAVAGRLGRLPGVRSVAPYALKGGMMKTSEAMQGVVLKGVDDQYDASFFAAGLQEGALPSFGDSLTRKELLISRALADMLRLETGDKVEMLFVQQERPPRRDRFKVCGIYSTGLEELDMTVVLTQLRNIRRLNAWSDSLATGYEVMLSDFTPDGSAAGRIIEGLCGGDEEMWYSYRATDIATRYPALFDWLRAHDVNAVVIIVIMLAVAGFNMISTLLIILLEHTSTIGLLKALGMTDRSVRRIFLLRSAWVVARGMAWGNVAGLSLCLLQRWTHIMKLDQAGYFLTEVPVDLGWGWWISLNIAIFALIMLMLALSTAIVSRITPDTAIRYH